MASPREGFCPLHLAIFHTPPARGFCRALPEFTSPKLFVLFPASYKKNMLFSASPQQMSPLGKAHAPTILAWGIWERGVIWIQHLVLCLLSWRAISHSP